MGRKKKRSNRSLPDELQTIKQVQCQVLRSADIASLAEALCNAVPWCRGEDLNGQAADCGLGTASVFQQPRGAILVIVDQYADPGDTAPVGCYYGYFTIDKDLPEDTRVSILPDVWACGFIKINPHLNNERRLVVYKEILSALRRQYS